MKFSDDLGKVWKKLKDFPLKEDCDSEKRHCSCATIAEMQ